MYWIWLTSGSNGFKWTQARRNFDHWSSSCRHSHHHPKGGQRRHHFPRKKKTHRWHNDRILGYLIIDDRIYWGYGILYIILLYPLLSSRWQDFHGFHRQNPFFGQFMLHDDRCVRTWRRKNLLPTWKIQEPMEVPRILFQGATHLK